MTALGSHARKKPGPTAKYRAKRKRADDAYALVIRAVVDERDGYCRFIGLSPCSGRSEWAHLTKRSQTRGMAPEVRHQTATTVKACQGHHGLQEAGKLRVVMTEKGADGPIRAQYGELVRIC